MSFRHKDPEISVLLPVYNADKFIRASVESVLQQSFSDFELLLIDDGSTDDTLKIASEMANTDERINILSNSHNGLVYSLNTGLNIAKGRYVARMDADDIAEMTRLEKQISYLAKNPEIALVGTNKSIIDADGNVTKKGTIPSSREIPVYIFFGSPFVHSSVMFNKLKLGDDLFYDENYPCAEDYELWCRLVMKYKTANIKNYFGIRYREHAENVSTTDFHTKNTSKEKAIIKNLGGFIGDKNLELHLNWLGLQDSLSVTDVSKWASTFRKKMRNLKFNYLAALKYSLIQTNKYLKEDVDMSKRVRYLLRIALTLS